MDSLFLDPAKEILVKVISFVWLSMVALVIIVIGWLLSKGIRSIVSRILKALKVDRLSEKAGIAKFLAKGGVSGNLSDLIAVIVYWLFMLVVVMVTANVLGLKSVAALMDKIVLYIPNLLAALIVLFAGALLAVFLKKLVQTAARNAGMAHARSMGFIAHSVIMLFAVIIALEQLKIGVSVLSQFITILFGSIGLALALSFGLGCRGIAEEAVRSFLEKQKNKK